MTAGLVPPPRLGPGPAPAEVDPTPRQGRPNPPMANKRHTSDLGGSDAGLSRRLHLLGSFCTLYMAKSYPLNKIFAITFDTSHEATTGVRDDRFDRAPEAADRPCADLCRLNADSIVCRRPTSAQRRIRGSYALAPDPRRARLGQSSTGEVAWRGRGKSRGGRVERTEGRRGENIIVGRPRYRAAHDPSHPGPPQGVPSKGVRRRWRWRGPCRWGRGGGRP